MTKQSTPYGSWKSPITSDLIISDSIRLGGIEIDNENIYWTEGRPTENGRTVIVRQSPDGITEDINPAPYNARSKVHEYGGGAYTVHHETIFFVNFEDQRIYRQPYGEEPQALTPKSERRYADLHIDPQRNLLICVVEDHSPKDREAENYLAAIDLENGEIALRIAEGDDFYASPELSPDGTQLAWLSWKHPNMPWDGTELWLAELDDQGRPSRRQQIAGGNTESVFQPQWSPGGDLYFITDPTGWWNLYRWKDGDIKHMIDIQAEFGQPQWIFRMSTYAFSSASTAYCLYTDKGLSYLGMLDLDSGHFSKLDTPYTTLFGIRASEEKIAMLAGSVSEAEAVCQYHLFEDRWERLRASFAVDIDLGYYSAVQPIEFPTANNLTAHALLYLPTNKDYAAPEGEKPPLVVFTHGGPTGATDSILKLTLQYWTSRGFAVLDVNYGGSTGYGRAYRTRLNGQWGVVDLQDCENGAKHLVNQGLVDGDRLVIRGGSAGGYTTLCALAFTNTFKAGGCYFGLADLTTFVGDTHKFESRYLDSMVGPYPEMKEVYEERSPINYIQDISCPVIFFQGLDDKIVPPNQSEEMFKVIKEKGLLTTYLPFEGEGHGFRKAENIKRSLDSELYFYSKVFGFEIADEVEALEIENLLINYT